MTGEVPGSGIFRRIPQAYDAHRYALLFYSLLLTLAANPLLAALGLTADLLQAFLVLNLLTAVFGVPGEHSRRILLLLVALLIAVGLPTHPTGNRLFQVALASSALIALVAGGSAVRFASRATAIDAEHLYAALSAYLLAGIFFGVMHWSIELAWPGSYTATGVPGREGGQLLGDAIYFSFVTLATLGYGDIVPKSPVARGVVTVEAIGGQLYLAVMIARLVGAHLQARSRPPA